jgi:hypothetical protein
MSQYHDAETIYHNVNYTQNSTQAELKFQYAENRLQPVLNNPEEWEMLVQKVIIPANSIPIGIADMLVGSTTNQTQWYIGFKYNGTAYMANVIWDSQDLSQPTPPVVNEEYRKNQYYWFWDVNEFLALINTALNTAWADLKANEPVADATPPYFIYDLSTQKISIIAPEWFYNGSNPDLEPLIFFNSRLHIYFDGFNDVYYGSDLPDNTDFGVKIVKLPYGSNIYEAPATTTPAPPAQMIKMTQYATFWSYWFTLKSFIIKSSYIPCVQESISSNSTTSASRVASSGDQSSAIIFDLSPDTQYIDNGRSIFFYNDTGSHRFISLNSSKPLKALNLEITWQDNFLIEHPLYIDIYQSVFIKLLFRRRHVQ